MVKVLQKTMSAGVLVLLTLFTLVVVFAPPTYAAISSSPFSGSNPSQATYAGTCQSYELKCLYYPQYGGSINPAQCCGVVRAQTACEGSDIVTKRYTPTCNGKQPGGCGPTSVTVVSRTTCGSQTSLGGLYCKGNAVYQSQAVYKGVCSANKCAKGAQTGTNELLVKNCAAGQVCSNGACANAPVPTISVPSTPLPTVRPTAGPTFAPKPTLNPFPTGIPNPTFAPKPNCPLLSFPTCRGGTRWVFQKGVDVNGCPLPPTCSPAPTPTAVPKVAFDSACFATLNECAVKQGESTCVKSPGYAGDACTGYRIAYVGRECYSFIQCLTARKGTCTPAPAYPGDLCGPNGYRRIIQLSASPSPTATASPTVTACSTVFDPVCGADGKSYPNECAVKIANVPYTKGACKVKKDVKRPGFKTPRGSSVKSAGMTRVTIEIATSPVVPTPTVVPCSGLSGRCDSGSGTGCCSELFCRQVYGQPVGKGICTSSVTCSRAGQGCIVNPLDNCCPGLACKLGTCQVASPTPTASPLFPTPVRPPAT